VAGIKEGETITTLLDKSRRVGTVSIHEPGSIAAGDNVPVIELKNVRRVFDGGRIEALRGVSLEIHRNEFVAIAGPSGCGKTTLLNLMGALDEPDEGDIFFDGSPLHGYTAHARFRARAVGFIFQSFHLLPTLTALDNVQIPMFEMPWSRKEREQRAHRLLEQVGLANRLHHLPSELSGGERQRVAAARSMANEPRILLADEPTGNLDSGSSTQLLDLLSDIHSQRGMTLVIVTHDGGVASRAGRTVMMSDGAVVSDQSADNHSVQ
jgi:putative ABC transport system ATP-binding protein